MQENFNMPQRTFKIRQDDIYLVFVKNKTQYHMLIFPIVILIQ